METEAEQRIGKKQNRGDSMNTIAREARQAAMRKRWESLDAFAADDMTVTDFYENVFLPWLEAMVKTRRKSHATLVTYERYWKTFLADHFSGKTLKTYSPRIGAQFLQSLRREDGEPYGEATIKHIHSTASGVFGQAVEREIIEHNPWRDVKVASVPFIGAEQGSAFTEEEVETMIASLDNPLAKCILAVGIWAGVRPSELAALQWSSIDLTSATLIVERAYVYGKEKATTKTGKARIVHFRDKLSPVLRAWWEANGRPESGWVFPNSGGNPVNVNALVEVLRPNAEKAGIGWKGLYALRRGCGSLLVQDGWNCEEVAQFLGNTQAVVWKSYFVDAACELSANARERSRAAAAGDRR
jgi:integrase